MQSELVLSGREPFVAVYSLGALMHLHRDACGASALFSIQVRVDVGSPAAIF